MLLLLFFMNFPLPANAGEEFGRCNASIMTPELVAKLDQQFGEKWPGYNKDPGVILQGLYLYVQLGDERNKWRLKQFDEYVISSTIAACGNSDCGGPDRDFQICYSREQAFTDTSTQGGEQCSSDEDILDSFGVPLQRGQTWWMLQIDRSGEETKYCQIEFKTLASGQVNPVEPPGTGEVRCVGLKPGDPCTGISSELPDIIQPEDEIVVDGDLNGLARRAIPAPALPNLALAVLAGVMGWLGIARSRRRRALR
jgi:hypothetical protein